MDSQQTETTLHDALKALVKSCGGIEPCFISLDTDKDGLVSLQQLTSQLKKHNLSVPAEKQLLSSLLNLKLTKNKNMTIQDWGTLCAHLLYSTTSEATKEKPECDLIPQKEADLEDYFKESPISDERKTPESNSPPIEETLAKNREKLKQTKFSRLQQYKSKVYENIDTVFKFSFMESPRRPVIASKLNDKGILRKKPALSTTKFCGSSLGMYTGHNKTRYAEQIWNEAKGNSFLKTEYKLNKPSNTFLPRRFSEYKANPRVERLKASFQSILSKPRGSLLGFKHATNI